jgi:hypothetical protein
MAEREGFEPSRLLHPNALAKRPLRPLGYLSRKKMAPRTGLEPVTTRLTAECSTN